MTAQHDSNSGANAGNGQGPVAPSAPMPARRRILVRGAAAALPTILTLHSGAALARSSNLIGTTDGAPLDPEGRVLCLDESSVEQVGDRQYDLGEPPFGQATAIPTVDRKYYAAQNAGSQLVTPQEMCTNGGTYYYQQPGGWKTAVVPRGGFLSAAAWGSVAASIIVREV